MPFPFVALALGASLFFQAKGLSEQRKAGRGQQRLREIQAIREKRRSIREARLARSQVQAEAGAAGIPVGASGPAGAVSSIGSQLGFNLSFLDETSAIQTGIAKSQEQASIFQAGAGIASTAFSAAGGFETIFRKNPGTA